MSTKILFNNPTRILNEKKYINYAISNNSLINQKFTKKCESLISGFVKKNNVLLTNSCTSALEIAALTLKNQVSINNKRNTILIPSYTFSSTAAAFLKFGFKVKFIDISPYNLMLDQSSLSNVSLKNVLAIVNVNYGSYVNNINEFKNICLKNKIYLIEDAAQAYGSLFKNKNIGTFGDFGCFSFHETKNIQSGLGGALIVKNAKLFKIASMIRDRGTDRESLSANKKKFYEWTCLGGSYIPTELEASYLYPQLINCKKVIQKRKKLFDLYYNSLNENRDLIYFPYLQDKFTSNYHSFWISFKTQILRDRFIKFMFSNNISCYIGYIPLHSSAYGKKNNFNSKLKNTDKLASTIVRLPLYTNMTIHNVNLVIKKTKLFIKLIKKI